MELVYFSYSLACKWYIYIYIYIYILSLMWSLKGSVMSMKIPLKIACMGGLAHWSLR